MPQIFVLFMLICTGGMFENSCYASRQYFMSNEACSKAMDKAPKDRDGLTPIIMSCRKKDMDTPLLLNLDQ